MMLSRMSWELGTLRHSELIIKIIPSEMVQLILQRTQDFLGIL